MMMWHDSCLINNLLFPPFRHFWFKKNQIQIKVQFLYILLCGHKISPTANKNCDLNMQLTHDVSGCSHITMLCLYHSIHNCAMCNVVFSHSHPHWHTIEVTQDECSPAGKISHTRSVACLAKEEKYQVSHLQDMCISIWWNSWLLLCMS